MSRLAAVALAVMVAFACSSERPEFSLQGATVDPTYWCPGGAKDSAYVLHTTVEAHNGTAKVVTIQSATAAMVLAGVTGGWLEKVGDRYDAGAVTVTPASVPAGATAKLDVAIPSSCTSGRYGGTDTSTGRYRVTVRLVTSAGNFTVTANNQHEIHTA